MAIFMTNIPRRKIYETMLEYEDAMIDMQIMLYSQENFDKFSPKFNESVFPKLKESYQQVKALFIMFFENKKHESIEDFEKDLLEFKVQEEEITNKINENKNLPQKFKDVINHLNVELKKTKEIETYSQAKELYDKLDEFNHFVPKILEIRRDHMKN